MAFTNKDILQLAEEDKNVEYITAKKIDDQLYLPVTDEQLKTLTRALIDYNKHRYITRQKYQFKTNKKEIKRKQTLFVYHCEVFNKIMDKRLKNDIKNNKVKPNLDLFKDDPSIFLNYNDSIVKVIDEKKLEAFIYKDFIYETYYIKFELEKNSVEYEDYRTLTKNVYLDFANWFAINFPEEKVMGRNTFYFFASHIFLNKNIKGPRYYMGLKQKFTL
jgi:tRNA G10  N-methylase Trm11